MIAYNTHYYLVSRNFMTNKTFDNFIPKLDLTHVHVVMYFASISAECTCHKQFPILKSNVKAHTKAYVVSVTKAFVIGQYGLLSSTRAFVQAMDQRVNYLPPPIH